MIAAILLSVVALGSTYLLFKLHMMKKSFPPGPPGLPIIGNLLDMAGFKNPYQALQMWCEKYDNLFTLWFLWKPIVVCGSEKALREILVTKSNEFAGRKYSMFRFKYLVNFKLDIGSHDATKEWVAGKKLFMNAIKMYGERLKYLEQISMEVVKDRVTQLDQMKGEPMYPHAFIHSLITDIMAPILFGRKLELESHKEYKRLDKAFLRAVSPASAGGELDLFPILHHIPTQAMADLKAVRDGFDKWISSELAKSKALYKPGEPQCVFDAIWEEQTKAGYPSPLHLQDDNIKASGIAFVLGGIGTSSSALTCMLAILASNLLLQRKLQEELDNVIGDRWVCLEDRANLHYTEAVIMETLRYTGLVPIPPAHSPIKDESLCGYKLPKDTECWLFLLGMHHSPKYWPEPMKFDPNRFLEEGKLVAADHPNRKRFLAFSAGRRVCPGEVLARNRLTLVTASIFQRFDVLPVEGDPPLPIDPREYEPSAILESPAFRVRLIPRI